MNNRLVYSGVDWLGEIPSSWKVAKVKNIFNHHKNVVGDKFDEYDRISLTLNGVILRDKDDANGLQPDKFDGYQIVNDEDIIFKLIDLENINTSRVGRSNYIGITSPAYILLHEKNKTSKYNEYYFINLYYQEVFNNIGGNGVRSAINKDDLLNIPLLVPSEIEKDKIVKFLDDKIRKIDKVIENNEKEIKLLDEYILNIYDTYCLKGVKEHRFKETNHYSINRIPESWNFSKVISVLEMPMTDGPHETPNLVDEGIPFLSADAVKNGKLDFNRKRGNISKEDYEIYCKKYIPKINDIFMIKSGATTGKVAIVETEDIFNIWSPLGVFRCDEKKIIPRFLYYQLQTNFFQKQVQLNWSFGTQQNIGMRVLEQLKLLVPSIDEQKEIVNKIEKKKKIIDKSIKIRQKIIDELEEYKKSLIYEAVTGKIEV